MSKIPGVFVEEKNAFPGSVLAVETAIPVFICYTERNAAGRISRPERAVKISFITAEDILDGILRVTVLMAISRPAEFIELTFQQQQQTA